MDYLRFSEKYQVPMYCGETGENEDVWVEKFRKVMDSCQIGWHYWPYKKLNSTRGIVTFKASAAYDSVMAYANLPRTSFEEIRKHRPRDMKAIRRSLDDLLEQCRFKNCTQNEGYIGALGFVPKR